LIIYYSIVFMENLILSIVWYCHRTGGGCLFEPLFSTPDFFAVSVTTETVPTPTTIPNSIAISLMIGINFLFFMGMVFMLMYYTFFHPSKNIPCWDCSHENAGHLNTAEATGLTGSTVATRNNHNIRQKRQGSQFRSWHSASLTYEENQEINKTLKKRPSSDILPESMNVFTENKLPDDTMKVSSIMEANSAACSCYSLRTTALGCQSVKSTPSRSNAALASAVVHQPTSRQHLDEAERKRRYFRQLIEQKKELEHQQAMLKINMERQISSYSLRKQKISDYEPYKQIKDSYSGDFDKNLKMYVPQSGDKPVRSHSRRTRLHSLEESPKHTYSPSFSHGTFPRYTRTHLTYNPQQKPAVPHTTLRTANYLKPISENKSVASSAPGLRDYSASLSNLTMPFPKPKQKVPRAMSFTVRKDEVIESMESSV
uniref:Uncharacterized protein n=1 Tax=Ciona savignyi TaxID=51511 RepID=H2YH25_CIOSA